jgi:S1-C subfamily serine protease
MIEAAKWVMVGVGAILISSCATPEPPSYGKSQGKVYYTKVNLWYAGGGKIQSMNYHQGTLLPLGTRVKMLGTKGSAIEFITDSGVICQLVLVKKVTRVPLEELFARHFTAEDILEPGGRFDRFAPDEQENIIKGTVISGMSKEGVLAAYGYPPCHKTPSLEMDTWTYLLTSNKKTVLTFREGYLVDVDGKVTPRVVRIYVVSDPWGAMVEVDGQFQGRTPCVVPLSLDPANPGPARTIRVNPSEPDYPRLGVVCGVPAEASVVGALITISEVLPTSVAQRLGLQPGDRILSINGKLVRSEQECFDLVQKIGFGGAVNVLIQRGASELRLQGQFEAPAKGAFFAQERKLTAAEMAAMHRKVLSFDLRTKPGEKAPGAPTPAPRTDSGETGQGARVVPPAGSAAQEAPRDPAVPIAGTGFVVAKGGYILTCAHLLGGANTVSVRGAGETWHSASVVKMDVVNDWCLLKAPTLTVDPLPVAPDETFAKGGPIYCAGYPALESAKRVFVAPEVKAGTLLEVAGLEGDRRHMQVMLPVWQGFSGSPVLDEQGRWMGLVSERLDGAIQAVAPRGQVPGQAKFALKTNLIRSGMPAEVLFAAAGKADVGRKLTAEDILKQVKSAIVMIQVKAR